MVAIIDFGGQYAHLIARRVRSLGVKSEIFPPQTDLRKLENLEGVILSGGPNSVYDKNAFTTLSSNLALEIPILGICYGFHLLAKELGGKVTPGDFSEYGRENISIKSSKLFAGLDKKQTVWFSHGDQVTALPQGFKTTASSKSTKIAAYENGKVFGVQFHPEVVHTENGQKILDNFIQVTKAKRNWKVKNQVESLINEIKDTVGKEKVLIAVSGGVDSLVACELIHRSVEDQIYPVFVDSGLLRKGEAEEVRELFRNLHYKNFTFVDASKEFLEKLYKTRDPERKRKIIGKAFFDVFTRTAVKISKKNNIKFLAQGTIYPDRIESASASSSAAKIKSHHNLVLPKNMTFTVLEPLKEFYKDEVRALGKLLSLPKERIDRHPFPGPGLAVRILGRIDREKLEILHNADFIYLEELRKAKLYDKIWQAFAALIPVKTVGVMGDYRTYQYIITIRAVTSVDGMTADWYKFPPEVLEKISSRIVNEVKGVNRVVYDVTQKPPGTIEYE